MAAGGIAGTTLHLATSDAPWLDITSAFGYVRDRRFRRISAAIYRVYPFPLLRFCVFGGTEGWRLGRIQPLSVTQASGEELRLLAERLSRGRTALAARGAPPPRHHRLGVLYDPDDPTAPSDPETLDKLARVAACKGLLVERIGKGDLSRLPVYDALFIRTVTALNHVSFTFAQTAASLGMPVIDDPASIIKCSNKIFLYKLFRKHGLPIPETTVLSSRNWQREVGPLGWPVVLKVPDGTFSLAVKLARSEEELAALAKELFKATPLLLAQRFTPSDFDWRIGLLEGRPIWAARYHMAPGHWQIARRAGSTTRYGRVEAVPLGEVPPAVVELSVACAGLIGDGLYGVDLKETENGPVLIEINDNPSLRPVSRTAPKGTVPTKPTSTPSCGASKRAGGPPPWEGGSDVVGVTVRNLFRHTGSLASGHAAEARIPFVGPKSEQKPVQRQVNRVDRGRLSRDRVTEEC